MSGALTRWGLIGVVVSGAFAPPASARPPDEDEEEKDRDRGHRKVAAPAASFDFEAEFMDAEMLAPAPAASVEGMGATPGGAQDVNLLRALIEAGTVPRPEQVTPEGLFSEHDLPLNPSSACEQLLCVHVEVTDARLSADSDLHYLAQLGFSSSLKPSEIQRPPLSLVFVVDTSSSMDGRPLDVVRESMSAVIGQLRPDDQVAIIGFDQRARQLLPPTAALDVRVGETIASLYADGVSHLDAGIYAGVSVARATARGFPGRTRIMLFTDDRPTYGQDRPSAFVESVRLASAEGIGMTTIGVGTRFDAALAREVAMVRGGNLMFFDDLERMRTTFEADFDTMVTELAHDLELVVEPSPGMRVAEVYGLPESAIQRRGDGIALSVETLFLSRRKGAIYFGLSPLGRPNLPRMPARAGMRLGEVRLTYQEVGGGARFSRASLDTVRHQQASPGLTRGSLLVDEAIAIREAARSFHDRGDSDSARTLVGDVLRRLEASPDPELDEQRAIVGRLFSLLGG